MHKSREEKKKKKKEKKKKKKNQDQGHGLGFRGTRSAAVKGTDKESIGDRQPQAFYGGGISMSMIIMMSFHHFKN